MSNDYEVIGHDAQRNYPKELNIKEREREMGNLGEEIEYRTSLENKLSYLAREVWGESAVEYLVGMMSSITTESQLEVLIQHLAKEIQ